MDTQRISSESDYDWALKQLEAYFETEPKPGSPEAERFDALANLVEAYEAKNWSFPSIATD